MNGSLSSHCQTKEINPLTPDGSIIGESREMCLPLPSRLFSLSRLYCQTDNVFIIPNVLIHSPITYSIMAKVFYLSITDFGIPDLPAIPWINALP